MICRRCKKWVNYKNSFLENQEKSPKKADKSVEA